MTKEEAKELLLHILMTYEPKDQYGDYNDPEPYEQALTMAIKALSAEAEWIPCDTSGMPPEGESVLMSDGNHIWIDETVAWWGDRSDWIGTAWMPLPTPYKGGDTK